MAIEYVAGAIEYIDGAWRVIEDEVHTPLNIAEVETKEQLRKNYWANALDSKEKNVKIATGTELDDYGNITVLSKT